jgi:phosphoserine phosphatase RsbU/P
MIQRMPSIFEPHLPRFTILADAWLKAGAAVFGIWSENGVLASWPPDQDLSTPTLTAQIQLDTFDVGELRVVGPVSYDAQARLDADAKLISFLLPCERDNIELAKLQTELELAQRVQLRLLPRPTPSIPGIEQWAIFQSASHVGGDFYDYIDKKDQPITFVVGDVSGKGMAAALLMTMTRTAIRTVVNGAAVTTPELIINRTNSVLYKDYTQQSMFATLFIGQYDSVKNTLNYANAGHSPVVYFPAGREACLLKADGPAIGILPEGQSENHCLQFQPGDLLMIGTDGLVEASNNNGSIYGYSRLLKHIESLAEKPARVVAEALFRSVKEFSSGKLQEDDQTLIVMKCVN